ncbi:TetR/AcrR family transcriptional regulator [Pantoea sp. EA-12]|uniref:TetR/AcrR family transcriptional regulator n=1 Tax=Pantoea sp. EA-12 TaxID=3043303 RepID=UPI0024B48FC1|nr:TetR/AcrR family transcriptional regulator [Pantoea sp. EA-12]MDI9219993.1 TetR/AcrR family transcriptional regulator [Pantoea sp. EA-12]
MLAPLELDASATASERILLSAQQLFYQHGIRATGVDKVIAAAGVTKVTFYRHFPAKNALIVAFLQLRHQRWMSAFRTSLAQDSDLVSALPATLLSWFNDADYRGCAFINTAAELGNSLEEASMLIRQHKQDMAQAIAERLTAEQQWKTAQIVLLIEGAIVQVQIGEDAATIVGVLKEALAHLLGSA